MNTITLVQLECLRVHWAISRTFISYSKDNSYSENTFQLMLTTVTYCKFQLWWCFSLPFWDSGTWVILWGNSGKEHRQPSIPFITLLGTQCMAKPCYVETQIRIGHNFICVCQISQKVMEKEWQISRVENFYEYTLNNNKKYE